MRRTVAAKKVTSSHKKGQTCIVSDDPVDGAALAAAIAATGYTVRSITVAPYEKKRFSLFGK